MNPTGDYPWNTNEGGLVAPSRMFSVGDYPWNLGVSGEQPPQFMHPTTDYPWNSSIPAWVLQGAAVDVDLVNNRAFVAGTGIVPITSLLNISRASNETYTDVNGLLSTVGNNALAIGSAGLQVWETRTNLLLQSNFAATWTASDVTITANAAVSPDGTSNAATLIEAATSGTHLSTQSVTKAASALAYTAKVYIKALGAPRGNQFGLSDNGGGNGVNITVSGVDGSILTAASAFGAGWSLTGSSVITVGSYYLISLSVVSDATTVIKTTNLLYNISAGNSFYTGDGTSGLDIFGASLEQAAFGSPLIPTTASTASRAADNVTAAGALLAAYQSPALTSYVKTTKLNTVAGATRILGLSGGASPALAYVSSAAAVGIYNGTTVRTAAIGSGGNFTTGSVATVNSFDGTGNSVVANGGAETTSTDIMSAITFVQIMSAQGSALFTNGNVNRLAVWNSRLSPAARIAASLQ